jgi:PAS domain S-box-containing protein
LNTTTASFSAPARVDVIDLAMTRRFFTVGGLTCFAGGLLLAVQPQSVPVDTQFALVAACMVVAAVFGLARWKAQVLPARLAVLTMGWACCGLITLLAVGMGYGLHSANLGFFALLVCCVMVMIGRRHGAIMASTCVAIIMGLLWAEESGHISSAASAATEPLWGRVLGQLLVVGAGWGVGLVLLRMVGDSLNQVAERERRFSALLRIGVDWYWEMDANFRFIHVSDNPDSGSHIDTEARLGLTPWEMPGIGMTEVEMAAHRADLEAHLPFSGTLARRRDGFGALRYLSISGEPKYDAQGDFVGYWGVGRDVTNEVAAQHAHAASETRYSELFERSPSALLLDRAGIVFDANGAAARMFGFASSEAMNGFNIAELYADPNSDNRADADAFGHMQDRLYQLETLPVGEGVPIADFALQAINGRRLNVQVTGVRVDTSDGPATLSIFYDTTSRIAAEAALRRSEAMLSHLFATSPDSIALTEMSTGRYTLVNDSFLRLTGHSREELIGRTSFEIGIWANLADRTAIVEGVREGGRVSGRAVTLRNKAKQLVPTLVSAARFEMDGQHYVVSSVRDMSEIEQVRLEHGAIFQNASVGIALTRERRIVQANALIERMFGWRPGQMAGQLASVVWSNHAELSQQMELNGSDRRGSDTSADTDTDTDTDTDSAIDTRSARAVEREMLRRDGSLFWCRVRAQMVNPSDPSQGGTIWVFEDITEERATALKLSAALEAAEAASHAKSAFLANTSHEIRTPLNGLLGLARLAMRTGLDAERRQQYLNQIFESAQSLSGIMTDVLDLSKIEAGKISLEAVPFSLRDMLKAVSSSYSALAEAKGLSLSLSIDDAVPAHVLGDPVRVRQILSNFTTNALKFTSRGSVRIAAGIISGGLLRLSVSDTGVGIASETQARLFAPFTQADTSTTRRYGGTGLGLSICRELATLMGGSVGMDSRIGVGSTFWADLPLPAVAAGALVPDTSWDLSDRLQGAHVLVVEDNPVNMMIVVAMLEQWGVQVAQVTDGSLALAAVEHAVSERLPFDMVLMDVQMPEMSGHEAARQLRQRYDAQALPIVALTAAALVSERDHALQSGMNDFLTKPIDAQQLRATVQRYAARMM